MLYLVVKCFLCLVFNYTSSPVWLILLPSPVSSFVSTTPDYLSSWWSVIFKALLDLFLHQLLYTKNKSYLFFFSWELFCYTRGFSWFTKIEKSHLIVFFKYFFYSKNTVPVMVLGHLTEPFEFMVVFCVVIFGFFIFYVS